MTPKLSIITPVKDQEKHIRECITSAQEQSFTNWEWIIIDDESKDNTVEIIQEYQAFDSRINLLKNKGKGIIHALQLAFANARGEFITRFDGDDIMPNERLELMYQAIKNSEPKTVVTGKVKYFSNGFVSNGYQAYESWLNDRIVNQDHWKWVYRECVIASPNWMARKKDLASISAFEELNYPEDYHLVIKWYQHGFQVKGLNQVTLNWREHSERTSRNSTHYDQEHFFRLKIDHLIRHRDKAKVVILWGTNQKAHLTASILKGLQINFEWMDLIDKALTKEKDHIQPYRAIENHQHVLLLLAVYPPDDEKNKLETYLHSLGLFMSQDYWYL